MKKCIALVFLISTVSVFQGCLNKKTTQSFYTYSVSNYDVTSFNYDSSLSALLTKYRDSINKDMKRIIGFSDVELIKKHADKLLDSFFVNTIMDFCISNWKDSFFFPEIALFNSGGLRNSIHKGDITVGNIFELMPFDNKIVIFEMEGKYIHELLDKMKQRGGDPFMAFGQVFNKKEKYDFLQLIKFDSNRKYMVVTSDYLLDRGDDIIKTEYISKIRFESQILIRDALIIQMDKSKK